ncbi:MAG TPA: hypothetical protein VN944_09165, partial [Nitrospiria bacterium]|nr:hypothetical protein [Nitrospiria bacterium]
KPSLESYLKQSLWYSCEGGEIKIGYPAESPFLAFMQKEESLKLMRDISMDFLRREARVTVVPLSASERSNVPDRAIAAKKHGGEAMVHKIQEALDGKIIEVKE